MSEQRKDQDKLLDHNYDGIQEYDNDLPKWWVQLFWVTIIWGVVYVFYFHFYLDSTEERLAADMQAIKASQQAVAQASSSSAEDEATVLLALTTNQEAISKGATVFTAKCAACHGAQGQGLVGPNLTDDNWIHGGKLTQIKNTIVEGVPAKGMLSWKTLMTSDEINSVVAFIRSIKGTNPPNPKAPEGEVFKE